MLPANIQGGKQKIYFLRMKIEILNFIQVTPGILMLADLKTEKLQNFSYCLSLLK